MTTREIQIKNRKFKTAPCRICGKLLLTINNTKRIKCEECNLIIVSEKRRMNEEDYEVMNKL